MYQKKCDSEPVYNKKYLKAKVNSHKGKINNFHISNFDQFCF